MKTLLLFSIVLVSSLAHFASADAPIWEDAKKAFDAKEYEASHEAIKQWLQAHPEGSPDAYYNMALSSWHAEKKKQAVSELARSALQRPYFWNRLRDLSTLAEMQKDLGIKENLASSALFQAHFAIGPHYWQWMGSFCIWLLAFASISLFARPTYWKWATTALASLALIIAAGSYGWHWFSQRHFRMAVVTVPEQIAGEVPLYRTAGEKEEDKLVELPAGTLVNIEKQRENYVMISAPLVGWIPTRNLEALD